MIRTVAIVDDHPVFRKGLSTALDRTGDLKVVGQAGDTRAALEMVAAMQPRVLVLDMLLPDGDGIDAIPELLRVSPESRILALTMRSDEPSVMRAFSAGVSGYATKTQSPDEILLALRTVAKGQRYAPPGSGKAVLAIKEGQTPPPGGPFGLLSRRERQVFDLVIRGLRNDEIGIELGISVKTVETHRMHINRILRVHSTGEVVRLAAMHGLIPRQGASEPASSLPDAAPTRDPAPAVSPVSDSLLGEIN